MLDVRKTYGFTILEILIAIGILIIISVIGVNFFVQNFHTYMFSLEMSDAIYQARKGTETAIKELREARDSEFGNYAIEDASAQELIFFSDIDDDQTTERVRYFLDNSDLKKGVIDPTEEAYPIENEVIRTIAQYIRNGSQDVFIYYDGDNNQLTVPDQLNQIKLIKIFLKININPDRAPQDFNLESVVQLRNLKENL